MTGDCIYINESEATPVCPFWCPIYVDANAAGYNDGSSWENAYNYLQDALNYARRCDCNDIRVAQGIYRPDQNSIYTDGTGDRTSTFHLISGVSIYGGFPPGGGEWEDRKPSVYDTNLSGDLLGNDREVNESRDLVTGPCRADNSYHVVSASDVNAATILDGFVITGGNAYGGTSDTNSGGGIYNSSGSPTVRNCTFIQNSAQYAGGGIYNTGDMGNPGEPNIINCVFVENEALLGGGIYTGSGPSPSPGATMAVTNCTFVGNSADSGGGMYNSAYSVLRVTNCILWGNVVEQISGGEVTYSDIEGGWTGEGNINKCPMFEADGYHLTMCSPCVDAGDPNGDYEGQVDIDSEPRLIGPYVDMGADEYYSEDYNIVKFAHCPRPKPSCGAMGALYVGESLDINLTWHPGIFAANVNGHDVYFGTSFSDVNEANEDNPKGVYKGHQSSTTYTAGNLLLCQMYFWRIDEINDACEPYLWKGPVRLFTTGLFIDDFERYTSSADFGLVWTTSVFSEGESGFCSEITYNSTGASIDLDICSGTMIYDYNNRSGDAFIGASALFSEARMESKISGVDWTIGNSNILSISYRGLATNSADNDTDPNYDRMYVAIIDAAGTMGRIVCNNDVNAQKQTTWQEWQIPFSDLKGTTSLDLTKEVNLIIGFGQRCNPRWMDISYLGYGNPGGTGRVWFDNIRLLQPNCNPTLYGLTSSGLISDFTGDSKVNMDDLEIMTQEWLHCGQADIYPDGIVDFCDFAVLAQQWLDEP
jgi:predicted outer membrane repeat protein